MGALQPVALRAQSIGYLSSLGVALYRSVRTPRSRRSGSAIRGQPLRPQSHDHHQTTRKHAGPSDVRDYSARRQIDRDGRIERQGFVAGRAGLAADQKLRGARFPHRQRDRSCRGAGTPADVAAAVRLQRASLRNLDMGLTNRLAQKGTAAGAHPPDGEGGAFIGATVKRKSDNLSEGSRRLKIKVHNRLFETIDISKLESLDPAMVSTKVSAAITDILSEDGRLLTQTDRDRLVQEIKNELLGRGPVAARVCGAAINDIMGNGAHQAYVEKGGKITLTDVQFHDDQHVMLIIDRIVSRVGRRVDEASPMVDARLPDGSRNNSIIPPPAVVGPL